MSLLWAYHPDDPVDPESPRPRLHYHGDFRRGAKSVFLLQRPLHYDHDYVSFSIFCFGIINIFYPKAT